jgi:hypothetical protein
MMDKLMLCEVCGRILVPAEKFVGLSVTIS